jgi:Cdc6-like AAA superfamily ATPase
MAYSLKHDQQIVGRQQEQTAILDFLNTNIKKRQSGLLYICGHPGQGKTALCD